MKIFRFKKNSMLYTITHVRPPKMTGSWYEAEPYLWSGVPGVKDRPGGRSGQMSLHYVDTNFDLVAIRNRL